MNGRLDLLPLRLLRSNVVSDDLWALLEPVLRTDGVRRGRPWNDHRLTLEAIYWHFLTGSPWRDLPRELGAWQSVWQRHRRWSADGTYERILDAVRESADPPPTDLAVLSAAEPAGGEPLVHPEINRRH